MRENNVESDRHKTVEYTRRDFLTSSAVVAGAGLAAASVAAKPSVPERTLLRLEAGLVLGAAKPCGGVVS